MNKWLNLAIFLILTVGGGLAIGLATMPDEWYRSLQKPSFNPPDWIFGPVWTVIYVLIALAGWRTWERDRAGIAMNAWFVQLVLNFIWSPIFFLQHSISGALAVIIGILAMIVIFTASSWRTDRIAALLFIPYGAWVAFATALNASIYSLN